MVKERMSSDQDIIETLTLADVASMLGISMKEALARVASGDILAIETGGAGKRSEYFVPSTEIDRFRKAERDNAEKKAEEEAGVDGRKYILVRSPLFDPDVCYGNEIRIQWIPECDDMTITKLVEGACADLGIDYEPVSNLKFHVLGDGVITKYGQVKKLKFLPVETDGVVYFVACVEFAEKGDEKVGNVFI